MNNGYLMKEVFGQVEVIQKDVRDFYCFTRDNILIFYVYLTNDGNLYEKHRNAYQTPAKETTDEIIAKEVRLFWWCNAVEVLVVKNRWSNSITQL